MISFLTSPLARWVAAGVLCLAVLAGAYGKGRLDGYKKFVQYKSQVEATAKEQQDKIDSLVKRQTQITNKAEVNHAKSIASLHSTYAALRLRGATSSGSVSKVPDPATEPDAAAAYYISVAPELAERCAQTTQQLTDLQDYVKDQSEVE